MRRKTLAKGIYEDASGRFIRISVNGTPVDLRREKDVKAADGTIIKRGRSYSDRELSFLRPERIRRQADATLHSERSAEVDTLFPADVQRFLATISSPGHRLNTQGYMAHWEQHFEGRRRNELTDLDVQTAFAAIDQAPSTKIHIRRALIQFYDALNGKSGYNPGRSIKKPAKPEEEVRDLPWADIEKFFKALQPSKSKARLMLIAYVGLPHNQIRKLKPHHLRLAARELVVHPRRKGAGVSGQVQPLSDFGIAALEEFVRVDAFGPFQDRQLVEMFWSGAERAGVTWPPGARPYDLRHSFLTEVARGGADIHDISKLGIHATIAQAARYIKGVAAERATKAIESIPRFSTTLDRQNLPIRSSSVASKRRATKPRRVKAQGKKR